MRREVLLVIFSTLLGTAIGYLIQGFDPSSLPHWAVVVVLILAALAVLAMLGPIRLLFSRTGPHAQLAGEWRTEWSYEKPEGRVTIRSRMTVRQTGRFITGEGSHSEILGPHQEETVHYRIKGQVNPDGIVEGRWFNTEREQYYGHFLGLIPRKADRVEAKWIGTTETTVHGGPWEWRRYGSGWAPAPPPPRPGTDARPAGEAAP